MSSRNFHILVDGSVAHSLETDTVSILLASVLSKPVSKETAKEDIQSPPSEVIRKVPIAQLIWQIGTQPFNHAMVEDVDVDDIVTIANIGSHEKPVFKVVKGYEILHKAFTVGKKKLNCVFATNEEVEA